MTARGRYLKELVDPQAGRISVRELAARLAARPEFPDDPEKVRRALHRHMDAGKNQRDVSPKYAQAISEILGLDPAEWPATRVRSDAALRQRVAYLEAELERARHGDPPAPAQDGQR